MLAAVPASAYARLWIHREREWNATDGALPDLVAARVAEVTAHLLRDPLRHKIAGALDPTGVR